METVTSPFFGENAIWSLNLAAQNGSGTKFLAGK